MGWDFGFESKTAAITDCLRETRFVEAARLLAKAENRDGLWSAWETVEGKRFIVLDLIEKYGGEWGVKSMTEMAGPCYYNCPNTILKAVPAVAPNEFNPAWRSKVETHKRITSG